MLIFTTAEGLPEDALVPYLHVISSSLSSTAQLHLAAVSPSPVKLKLWEISFEISNIDTNAMKRWVDSLQSRAYAGEPSPSAELVEGLILSFAGINSRRRLLVFVNPHGGQGKAQQIWEDVVAPIFKAARCGVHLQRKSLLTCATRYQA